MSNYNKSGGSRFEDEGKAYGWWLAPLPGLKYVVKVARQGAKKYAPLDWTEGQDFSALYGCVMRHMLAAHPANKGMLSTNEDDGNQMHLAHAAWNLLCLLSLVAMDKADECDDVSMWEGVTSDDVPDGESYETWSPNRTSDNDKHTGRVHWFDPQKGYGFIDPDYNDDSVYVHFSDIDQEGFRSLSDGDRVEYNLEVRKNGPCATNVHTIDEG